MSVRKIPLDDDQVRFLRTLATEFNEALDEFIKQRKYYYDIFLEGQFLRQKFTKKIRSFLELTENQTYHFEESLNSALIIEYEDGEECWDSNPMLLPQPKEELLLLFNLLSYAEEALVAKYIDELKKLGPNPNSEDLLALTNEVFNEDITNRMELVLQLYEKQIGKDAYEKYSDKSVLVFHRKTKSIFRVSKIHHLSIFTSICRKLIKL